MKHEINNAAVPIQKTSGQYPICDVVGGDFFAAGQVRSLVFIVHLSVSTLPYLVVAHSLSLYIGLALALAFSSVPDPFSTLIEQLAAVVVLTRWPTKL